MNDRHSTAWRDHFRASICCALAVATTVSPAPSPRLAVSAPALVEPASIASTHASPNVLEGGAAVEVLVRVTGGRMCSGTPLAGTRYVVTAAHCVLDPDGEPGARTVVRGNERFDAVGVFVDTEYDDQPSVSIDAAVLVLERALPGPAAVLGTAVPPTGTVTLAGYQPLDSDGTLLRGTTLSDRPLPSGGSDTLIRIESAPAGCVVDVKDLEASPERINVPCGLIPGASGGGLFADAPAATFLIGIVSMVTRDLSGNAVVPIASVRSLIASRANFHDVRHATAARQAVVRD